MPSCIHRPFQDAQCARPERTVVGRLEFRCFKLRYDVHNGLETGVTTYMPLELLGIFVIRHHVQALHEAD